MNGGELILDTDTDNLEMALPDLDYCTITELSQGLIRGLFTSSDLVKERLSLISSSLRNYYLIARLRLV